jgi:thiol-disulfide isomerase/thioredoxin
MKNILPKECIMSVSYTDDVLKKPPRARPMKNTLFSLQLAAIILFAVFFFSAGRLSASTKMPVFSLPDVTDGKTVFATWCPPCMEEVPSLVGLQKELARDGFSVIGLSVDEGGPGVVGKMVVKMGINYPVAMADRGTITSFGGVYGIPVSFLVNQNGNIVKKYTGYVPPSVLANDIKTVMK